MTSGQTSTAFRDGGRQVKDRTVAGDHSAALEDDALVGYDWAARQMIQTTQFDAAYGVMMMGYAQPKGMRQQQIW